MGQTAPPIRSLPLAQLSLTLVLMLGLILVGLMLPHSQDAGAVSSPQTASSAHLVVRDTTIRTPALMSSSTTAPRTADPARSCGMTCPLACDFMDSSCTPQYSTDTPVLRPPSPVIHKLSFALEHVEKTSHAQDNSGTAPSLHALSISRT